MSFYIKKTYKGVAEEKILGITGLYNSSTSAVYKYGAICYYFDTSVGVRQGCLLSPTLFNIFLERIMTSNKILYMVILSL